MSSHAVKRERSETELPSSSLKRQKDNNITEFPPLPLPLLPAFASSSSSSSASSSSSSFPLLSHPPHPPLPPGFASSPALKSVASPGTHRSPGTPPSYVLTAQPAVWDQLAKKWFECVLLLRCTIDIDPSTSLSLALAKLSRWGAVFQFESPRPSRLPFPVVCRLNVTGTGPLSSYSLCTEDPKRPGQPIYLNASGFDKLGRVHFRLNDDLSLAQITACVSANVISTLAFNSSYFASPLPSRPPPDYFGFVPTSQTLQRNQSIATSASFSHLSSLAVSAPQLEGQRLATDQRDSEFLGIFGNYSIGVSISPLDQSACLFEKMFHEQCVTHVVSQYLPTLGVELAGLPLPCSFPWSPSVPLVADVVVFRADTTLLWASTSFLHVTPHPLLSSLFTLSFIPEDDRASFEITISLKDAVPSLCSARVIFAPTKASKVTRQHSKLLDISLSAMKVRSVQHSDW